MKTIVVKIGTSSLIGLDKKLNQKKMINFVRQINCLREGGNEVILVTSGAIAAGREKMVTEVDSIVNKQMLASVGQVSLMRLWDRLFAIFDIHVGQLLLTKEDFHHERGEHASNTLRALLSHGALPVINENDSVAIDEIKVGDNDNLSAYVARLVQAHLLIILTDQQGLYTADPRYHPEATLIQSIQLVGDEPLPFAGGTSQKGVGTGGMATKIEAARTATKTGTKTIIASSATPDVLVKLVAGENIGTHFLV